MHVASRAAMVVLVLLLSGCGSRTSTREELSDALSDSASPSLPPSSPPSVAPTTSSAVPTTSAPAAGAEELARLAESAQAAVSALPSGAGAGADAGTVEGADVSWPQCPKGMGIPQRPTLGSPMPLDSARFVILGLTNGPGFTANPCLADQVAWARQRHLLVSAYSVISWPSAEQLARYGTPAKAGRAQALANLATLKAAGLTTPAIWLDVEPVPDFDWPSGKGALAANAEVVTAVAQTYADSGYQVGVYSTTALWQRVVGTLSLGLREWRAAGHTSRAEALVRCGAQRTIQGGSAVLAQWVEDGRDRNVTCPGGSAQLTAWFSQY